MGEIFEMLGELLTTAMITKKGIYLLLFLLGILVVSAYYYFK